MVFLCFYPPSLHARSLSTGYRSSVSLNVSLRDPLLNSTLCLLIVIYYGNFFDASKTTEMALFHVWHFKPFSCLKLKLAGIVHSSMFYDFRKLHGHRSNITWLIAYGKPHVRRLHGFFHPWGEVPPDFTPRSPDFVLQLAFDVKWPRSKFELQPLKPGGAMPCVFVPFWPGFRDAFVSLSYLCLLLVLTSETC